MADPTANGDSSAAPGPSDGALLEMRQVAGLTAGGTTPLQVGSVQFSESDGQVGFTVDVRSAEDATLVPGSAVALVDETRVEGPTPLAGTVVNVGSACFALRPPLPPVSNRWRHQLATDLRRPNPPITVPDLQAGGQAAHAEFLQNVRWARSAAAERYRLVHPNPEELLSRLERLDPGLWDRTIDHPMFGRFAVAYSTIPWEPRFDAPERVPHELHDPIRQMSRLPWVPVTANLLVGPLGIVGARPAALAAARHAALSLAALSAPSDVSFSIVTAEGLIEDWSWTSALPNSLFTTDDTAFPVVVADGMEHFEGAGFDLLQVVNKEVGLIAVGESPDHLPECSTMIEISPNGQCQISNHLGETIVGTPIGITAAMAARMASLIDRAVDGPFDDAPAPSTGDD